RCEGWSVEAGRGVAMLRRGAGVETLVDISGIGADARSASPYIRSRGRGEAAVLDAFPSAKLIRPAVMFGPGDAFLRPLLRWLRHMPVFPMFGSGKTRLQPAYVDAEATVRVSRAPATRQLYELAGPRVYTYQELLRTIAAGAGTRPFLDAGDNGCRSERGSVRFLLFDAPFHRADRPHGLGGLRFALLLGGFGVPAVEFEDVLAGERLLVPVEELRRRIGLVVMLAVWEDRELVEVFGEPWRGLGDVDK